MPLAVSCTLTVPFPASDCGVRPGIHHLAGRAADGHAHAGCPGGLQSRLIEQKVRHIASRTKADGIGHDRPAADRIPFHLPRCAHYTGGTVAYARSRIDNRALRNSCKAWCTIDKSPAMRSARGAPAVSSSSTEIPPSPESIRSELERIAASHSFRKAERCLRLLRHVTERTLAGRGGELKEYSLAADVFERPESFDSRTDPVVRLEARRLRLKLAEYYQQEGLDDPVVIDLPKGAYVPSFRARQPAPVPPPAETGPLFRLWPAVAAAALCLSLGAWYLVPRHPKQVIRTSIAVLGFRDLAGGAETSWIDPAVSELMAIELGAGQQLRTLPAENVARTLRDLSLAPQAALSAQTLGRIRSELGADYMVAGAYRTSGDRVHLDVVLFDLRSGRQIAALGDDAAKNKLPELAEECARRIRAHLGVRLATVRGDGEYPPAEPAAMEAYARGMERLRQSDALGARAYLERAAALAPPNPLVHAGLAAAWSMLGLDNRALDEAKQAYDSSSALSRVQQLEIEGRYREIAHDWPRAIQVYQALVTLLPDDLEYGLLLANAESRGGKSQDALAFVNSLRNLPAPMRDDPRIDMAEAHSAGALADYARTRRAAHRAAEKARQQGARLQYARARLLEAGAMQILDIAGYADVRAEARSLCSELGDRACVAASLRIEANAYAAIGAIAKARPLFNAVLEVANQMGNQLEKLNALAGLAYIEDLHGDLKTAEAYDRQALEVGTEIGSQKRAPACIDLAQVLLEEGRTADSRALAQEALDLARQMHDAQSIGAAQTVLARVLDLEGKSSLALAEYREAVVTLKGVQEALPLTTAVLGLGDAQLRAGDLAAARQNYEEAAAFDRQHRSFKQPEVDMAFARLAMAEGRGDEAAHRARAAMAAYQAAGRAGDRVRAAALLARALVTQGDIAAASAALAGIRTSDGESFPVEAAVEFRIARSLVDARTGHHAEADRAMTSVNAEVSRLGLLSLQREARLARDAVTKAGIEP